MSLIMIVIGFVFLEWLDRFRVRNKRFLETDSACFVCLLCIAVDCTTIKKTFVFKHVVLVAI